MSDWELATLAARVRNDDVYVWRMDNLLVVLQGAELPKRCLRTNRPATVFVRSRNLSLPSWSWMLIGLLLLGGVCGIVPAIFLYSKSQNLDFSLPFCEAVIRKNRRFLLMYLTAIVLASASIPLLASMDNRGGLISGILFVGFAAFVGKLFEKPLVEVDHIDANLVFIKNVHPDYLADLPSFQ